MPMRFLESWDGHTVIAERFDNVPTSLLPIFVRDTSDVDNKVSPSAWCLEVGVNKIQTAAKQVVATDELVVGFQYTWDNTPSPTIAPSVDIEFENVNFTNIEKLNIKGGNITMGGIQVSHGQNADIGDAYFEVRFKQHPSLGQAEVWVNGVQKLTVNSLARGTAKIEFVRFGTDFQNPSFEQFSHMFFDDISGEGAYTPRAVWLINRTAGASTDVNLDFTDPGNVLLNNPGIATAGQVGAKLISNTPGNAAGASAVHAVQISHSLSKTGTEPLKYKLSMSVSSTNVELAEVAIASLGLHSFVQVMDEDPSDQTPLTIADIATVKGGVEITDRGL